MSTKHSFWVVFGVVLLFPLVLLAQSSYRFGALPSVNLNVKLKNDWSTNFKIESRQQFQEGNFGAEKASGYSYVLTDYSAIVAKKTGLNSKLSGGYLLRFRDNQMVHRLIQQYTITQRLPSLRLAHRVVTDQTLSPKEKTEFRLRYRLATEIPLNGQSADVNELYLKLSNEYLNSLQDAVYDLEVRLVPLLGYTASESQRVEMGLNYRLNSFVSGSPSHSFWLSINWYIVI